MFKNKKLFDIAIYLLLGATIFVMPLVVFLTGLKEHYELDIFLVILFVEFIVWDLALKFLKKDKVPKLVFFIFLIINVILFLTIFNQKIVVF